MLKLETRTDLEELYTGQIKESLELEYKASPAVDRDEARKQEMARDVSAFANSEGGQIVYGMTEEDHAPAGLDSGIDLKRFPEIWFEQVLQQHIKPRITGLRIHHVPLDNGNVAVVIDIPATTSDPHQASDHRYYRRHNYNRLPMEHYEVRDAMRRTVDPALELEFDELKGEAAYKTIEFSRFRDVSDPVPIAALIKNKSNQPAMYTHVSVFIDRRVKIAGLGAYENAGIVELGPNDMRHHLRQNIGMPGGYPIFREMSLLLEPFSFTVGNRLLGQTFALGYQIRCPGCFKESHGSIETGHSGQMHIHMPLN